ncbi:glycosyltransferase family 2 protein [Catenuloplanes sp. NPDC051500]|uniref:glycosyltransferase family 2 protein n=1 Tax=Catenuloplanes sp. NPDC051500 TaxID=3363959 RepID=UPI00379AC045
MSHANTLVSVIVPSYNSIRTLRLCLESIRAQTYTPIQMIVVDDESTDGSDAIAEELGATLVRTGVNSGVAVARNMGVDAASGEILFFLDSDLAMDPRAVDTAVTLLESMPHVGVFCGAYEPVPLIPTTMAGRYRTIEQGVWFNEIEAGPIRGLYSAIFATRKETFRAIGPFNTRLRWTEDMEYGIRILQRYEMWVSRDIHGRHDHDRTLYTIFRKVWQRTRLGIQLWTHFRQLPGGAAAPNRALSSVTALAAALALPLPLLVGPLGALATPLLVLLTIGLDPRMYRYAFTDGGLLFGLYFTAVRIAVVLTTAVAAGTGILQYLLTGGHRAGVPVKPAGRRRIAVAQK